MQSKKEKKKIIIALQAYDMLVEKGVESFSVNNLLETISMSKGNFYHYFKNKDELFCKAIKLAYYNIIASQPPLKSDANFEEKLHAIFYIYLTNSKEVHNFLEVINQMYYHFTNEKNQHLYNYMQESYAYIFFQLEQAMKEAIKAKELDPAILNMVKPLVATADGMLTHSFMIKEYDFQKELQNYLHFIATHYRLT